MKKENKYLNVTGKIKENKPKRKSKFFEDLILVIITVILTSILIIPTLYIGTYMFAKVSIIDFMLNLMPQDRIQGKNILVYGIDDTTGVQRADSIMVVHINHTQQRIGVLSIPRDTRAYVPGKELTKINHSFAYGGVNLLKKTVSDLLGIPIDYFVQINLSGVEKTIDQMGGVMIDIKKDLYYIDKAGDLYIDLKKGQQTLTGKQAVQYLRFRHDKKGDFGRIERQQTFVRSFAKKVINSGKFFELPSLIKSINKNIKTDISLKEMIGLANQCSEIYTNGNIFLETIPGAIILYKGVSYLRPDIVAMDRLIRHTLYGFEKKELMANIKVQTVDDEASQQARRNLTVKEINRIITNTINLDKQTLRLKDNTTIEVLNGCGISGQARHTTRLLKKWGLKVARFGNASCFEYQNTLLVDWKGEINSAIALAQALSIDPSRIIVYDRPEKSLDITLVIGMDWKELKATASKTEQKGKSGT